MATKSGLGSILSEWRDIRRLSQFDLALAINVSQRHLSFIESGRARPSRDMIQRIADGLELSLRTRNELFLAAGYAPPYPERRLDLDAMKSARDALGLILDHHEPFPAIVTDAAWNIVLQNRAAERIVGLCVDADSLQAHAGGGPINFMRMMFAPWGLQPRIVNYPEARKMLLGRLRREALAHPGSPSDALWHEIEDIAPPSGDDVSDPIFVEDPVLPLELQIGDTRLKLFNMLTTFGTPRDITLQELRIDMAFPADEASRRFLEAAAIG